MQETKLVNVKMRKRIETKRTRNETDSKGNAEIQHFGNGTKRNAEAGNGWKRMETDGNGWKRMETLKTDGNGRLKPEGKPEAIGKTPQPQPATASHS